MNPYEVTHITDEYYIGTVVETDLVNRKVAVHIPKLMPQVPPVKEYNEKIPTVTYGQISVNINALSDTVTKRSSVWVRALDKDIPMPTEGSKVMVFFLDENPNSGFWSPFNVKDVDYEEDPDDKFEKEKLFTINFKYKNNGDQVKTIDIHRGDVIDINMEKVTLVNVERDANDKTLVKININ